MNQLSDDTTITRRICEEIKDGIRQGRYGPGARLPSTRTLAAEWGVSRTTVTAAYGQLIAEGYLDTRPGARSHRRPSRIFQGRWSTSSTSHRGPMRADHLRMDAADRATGAERRGHDSSAAPGVWHLGF
jgi:DNA-binding transcriptional MocR family regulator